MGTGEKNEKSKQTIRGKVSEYMARAEKLKIHIDEQNAAANRKKPSAMGANGKASGKGGKYVDPVEHFRHYYR